MRDSSKADRYNLAKLKILKAISSLGEANSIQIAERTFKTVNQTTPILNYLFKQKRIRKVSCSGKNDGCSNRFTLTKSGERYLLDLQSRFLRDLDLNLYYPPMKAQLKPIDMKWKAQEYPTTPRASQKPEERKIIAPPKAPTKDDIDKLLKEVMIKNRY